MQGYPEPFVPSEKGYDQTDVPSEQANEGQLPLPVGSIDPETGKVVPVETHDHAVPNG